MAGSSPSGTRWFSLSGRELLVLVISVGIILAVVAAARGVEFAFGREEVRVSEAADVMPLPARLDINTARDFELAVLPGIGPKTAAAIVEYRTAHGPFASIEALCNVKGIGQKTVERIRPHAMCAPTAPPQDRTGK